MAAGDKKKRTLSRGMLRWLTPPLQDSNVDKSVVYKIACLDGMARADWFLEYMHIVRAASYSVITSHPCKIAGLYITLLIHQSQEFNYLTSRSGLMRHACAN